ncbi:hypothetical protein CDAR_252131 [Caerostris darwini]|uniref:Uncharacterized protein n=1 Tax=Caerostris darwini TaxID=1538125 RepID=A0AAV4QA04_9ARAC|nr:hypothetical protein CDAR_252131 [Caerostris darwini]
MQIHFLALNSRSLAGRIEQKHFFLIGGGGWDAEEWGASGSTYHSGGKKPGKLSSIFLIGLSERPVQQIQKG